MIKVLKATPSTGTRITLAFSDGSKGDYDLHPLIARNTVLTAPLADTDFRNACYLELGALCWTNGLELSATSLHEQMKADGTLQVAEKAA